VKVGTGYTNLNKYPCTGDTIGVYSYPMTINTASTIDTNLRVTATCYNAYGNNGGQASATQSRLLDTYASGVTGPSTEVSEPFNDEWYRLPSGSYTSTPLPVSGSWRSQTLLSKC
jgi:hypothetical protein